MSLSDTARAESAGRRSLLKPLVGVALVVLAAVVPLLAIDVPGLLPGPTYSPGTLQILAYGMLIAALALSYHLIFGLGGMLSFGHGMFFAAGAYGLAIVLDLIGPTDAPAGAMFALAIVITLVGSLLLGAVVGAFALRVSGIPFAMVTLAFAQALNVIIRRNTGGVTGGEEGVRLEASLVPDLLLGVANTRNLYWLALVVLVLVYLVTWWVEQSRLGRMVAAARENDQRVQVLGVRPYPIRLFVFVAAALLAGVAGIGFVLLQSGTTPRISTADFTLTLLVIVVLGGVGYRWGAIVGGLLYTLLDQRLTAVSSSSWVESLPTILQVPLSEPLFILGVLFIIVVMFVPGGIAGLGTRATARTRTVAGEPDDE